MSRGGCSVASAQSWRSGPACPGTGCWAMSAHGRRCARFAKPSTTTWSHRCSRTGRGPGTRAAPERSDPDVLELPGIRLVQIFGEQPLAIMQRRPVRVGAFDGAEVRQADLEVAPEIHFVGLDQADVGILHGPDHSRQAGHRDLQAGGVVVRAELARLVDPQARAIPVRVLLVAGQQYAQLIDT